jgi:hypothetical protein
MGLQVELKNINMTLNGFIGTGAALLIVFAIVSCC